MVGGKRGGATITPTRSDDGPLFPSRIGMLDGWRGLAALAVLFQHLGQGNLGVPAVMLFFVISGYCIAAAADGTLRNGIPLREFFKRRMRRVFPPYLCSLAFYLLTRGLKKLLDPQAAALDRTPVEYLQNATLTQWVTLLGEPLPTPWANPTLFVTSYWSLGYEEQFYLMVGLLMASTRWAKLEMHWWLAGVTVLALLWTAGVPALCYGLFLDYWLQFAVGVLVFYRLCRFERPAARRASDGLLLALVLCCGWMSWQLGFGWETGRRVYNELLVAGTFGLLLVASRRFDSAFNSSALGSWLKRLGTISFSLYLVHQFNMQAMRSLGRLLAAGGQTSCGSESRSPVISPWPRRSTGSASARS